jgi:hypothetical protein
MKKMFKVMLGVTAAAAVTASAGSFPFPQNMKYPHGHIIEYANTDVIKQHYESWKKAWYNASQGWVYAPEGTCSTVSEAIAYGMLISVYMDDQSVFDKLYGTWKSNGGNGGGMNWRVGCQAGSGSASDADFDAALALVMASKQWGGSYLNDAKSIISWIASNDISGNKIKPGNQWNDAFNPSYAATANFQLFQDVNGGSWSGVISQAYTDLSACQDSKTGLVPDWCDWNSHKPRTTSAAVSNDIGFYDDAARTPWRMAMAYYWYGDSKAQSFNKKVMDWLIPATRTASGVNSGYKWVDSKNTYEADESDIRNFVSSTFSGGLGLAVSSFDTEDAKTYLTTVYKVLVEQKSCSKPDGCGEGSNPGEKYYPATLNMIYLLLVTGNMPNLYKTDGFTKFTPDTSKAPSIKLGDGEQQEFGDTTVSVSGLWNWGAYHDKLGIGTEMLPDSGSSPIFKMGDGSYIAHASMKIGPEPEWTEEKAKAGLLKYPSAGIAVSFKKDECKKDKSCGVNFKTLGVKYIRVTAKSSGPIRMAILNTITDENEEKKLENAGAGSEPGIYVDNSSDYKEVVYDMTPYDYGFMGVSGGDKIDILDWVSRNNAPEGAEILEHIKGIKWEVKDAKGGIGEISIKAVEFLDDSKQVIDYTKITGLKIEPKVPPKDTTVAPPDSGQAIYKVSLLPSFSVQTAGMQIQINGIKAGSVFGVYDIMGKVISSGIALSDNMNVRVPMAGSYIVRVGSNMRRVNVK